VRLFGYLKRKVDTVDVKDIWIGGSGLFMWLCIESSGEVL